MAQSCSYENLPFSYGYWLDGVSLFTTKDYFFNQETWLKQKLIIFSLA